MVTRENVNLVGEIEDIKRGDVDKASVVSAITEQLSSKDLVIKAANRKVAELECSLEVRANFVFSHTICPYIKCDC